MIVSQKEVKDNSKLISFDILKEDEGGQLCRTVTQAYTSIYRIKLTGGRVYIGQSRNVSRRIDTHKLRFVEEFISYKVLEEEAKEYSEINQIAKYRSKLGHNKVVNVSAGEKVPVLPETVVTLWRNISATQKAIFAYKEFTSFKEEGIKVTQVELAEKHGVHMNDLSLVKKLITLASTNVIDALFNGGKIKLSNGKHTDNLRAVIKHFQMISDESVEDAFKQPLDITDDEWEMIKSYTDNVAENHASPVLIALGNSLLRKAKKEMDK